MGKVIASYVIYSRQLSSLQRSEMFIASEEVFCSRASGAELFLDRSAIYISLRWSEVSQEVTV
jgi:hypothetical protein